MSFVGADLSKKFVYLACVQGKKINTATIDIFEDPLKGLELMSVFMANVCAKQVFIERPWINNKNPRPLSSMDLGRASAFVEMATLIQKAEPIFVFPSEWRKVVYGTGKPADIKELARRTVLEKFGYETTYKNQHNTCEAILLSYYGSLINE